MAHLQTRSTAPQQMELAGSRCLAEGRRTRVPGSRKTLEVRLRSTNLSTHAEPRIRTRVVEVEGTNDDHYANLTQALCLYILVTKPNLHSQSTGLQKQSDSNCNTERFRHCFLQSWRYIVIIVIRSECAQDNCSFFYHFFSKPDVSRPTLNHSLSLELFIFEVHKSFINGKY